jgi:hypothetical protein
VLVVRIFNRELRHGVRDQGRPLGVDQAPATFPSGGAANP